jgi:serine/threonine-protein kinase
MDTLIGQRLGQYEIIAKIGAGGMATVYRARQASVDRDVALKVIRADLMEDENFLGRFQREARMIASLQHLHVLKVFDYGNEGSIAYLVMELLEGGSLNRLLRRGGALPLPLTVRMIDQISMALDYAHGRGIIHRDLKPDNVLLDQHQNAFLTDFGIAKLLSETTSYTRTGMVMGTPAYMAPELWSGQPADARADIYALGVILYEMVTGISPFSGDTPFHIMHRHIYEMPPSTRDVNNSLPATVDSVIGKALAKDANQRFNTAGQLAEAFREALNGQDISRIIMNTGDLTAPVPADFPQPTPKPTPARSRAELSAPTLPPNLPEFGTPAPSRLPTMPHPQERRRGTPLVILALILIAAVIGVGILAAVSASSSATAETQSALDLTITAQALAREGTATSQAILLLPSVTEVVTETPTNTPTATPTETPSATLTPILTETPSRTLSSTPSATRTATPSRTATPTLTATPSRTASATPTATPTPTQTPSRTATPTPTVDTAAIVAATLAPIQTATALAVQIQQTVDAVLGAERATADAQATRREQQNQLVTATLRAAQTLAQGTLDAQATRIAIDTQGTLRALEENAARTATAQFANITPTAVRCPGFLTSRLVVGGYGRVTPGDPNRLREVPGGVILTQILAGETFRILEGPVCTESNDGLGLAWWRVEYLNPRNNRTYIGWTAEGSGGVYWIEPINRP